MTLRRRMQSDDSGFTLIELIVVTAVLAIILGALGTGVITLLRTTGTVTDRMIVSHDEQLLNEWITADMQSATNTNTTPTDLLPTAGCTALLPSPPWSSTNVVRFSWQDRSTGHVYHAAYRVEHDSSSWELVRYFCPPDGEPLELPSRLVVAHDLKPGAIGTAPCSPPVTVCVDDGVPTFRLGVTSVSGADERTFTVSASRRTADPGDMDSDTPRFVSAVAYNTDANGVGGLVNRVVVTFDEPLNPDYTAGTPPWTLTNTPNNATLSSVSVQGNVATLALAGGTGTADTEGAGFTVSLSASAQGIRDGFGNQASFTAQTVTDGMGPVPLGAVAKDSNADTQFDEVAVTFSEPLPGDQLSGFTLIWPGQTLTVLAGTPVGSSLVLAFFPAVAGPSVPPGVRLSYPLAVRDSHGNPAAFHPIPVGDGSAPLLTKLTSIDSNQDGRIDQIRADFDEALASPADASGWTFTKPAAGWAGANPAVTGVGVSGSTALLSIGGSGIPIDTAASGLGLALASSPTGIRDSGGNMASAPNTPVTDGMAPILAQPFAFAGGTPGRFEGSDTLTATFSEPLQPSSTTVIVSLHRNSPSSSSLRIPNFLAGTVDLGASYIQAGTANWNNSTVSVTGATVRVVLGVSCNGTGCARLVTGSAVTAPFALVPFFDAVGIQALNPATAPIRWF
jgi:prepilin-type N-terminal cleavage/methylation domain-containing protein